jgi:AraC family transcriptional regulator
MEPKIVQLEQKMLVGVGTKMSLANDKTGELWQQLMPKRKEIMHRTNNGYWSVQKYESLHPDQFAEETIFEKWAAVEVSAYEAVPEGLTTFELPGGLYAVLIHHGMASEFHKTMKYILNDWLPTSGYQLDDRPHFEIMGSRYYGPTDANSKEEVWIPIQNIE